MAEDKTLNFENKGAFQRYLAYGHMHGLFKKPGSQTIHISGQPHRVSHDDAPCGPGGLGTEEILAHK